MGTPMLTCMVRVCRDVRYMLDTVKDGLPSKEAQQASKQPLLFLGVEGEWAIHVFAVYSCDNPVAFVIDHAKLRLAAFPSRRKYRLFSRLVLEDADKPIWS